MHLSCIYFQTGHNPLQRAASEGHLEVVKQLIERGSPVDHQDEVVSVSSSTFNSASHFFNFFLDEK